MKDLKLNESIVSYDMKLGTKTSNSVLTFLHKEDQMKAILMKIITLASTLQVSGNHLVYFKKSENEEFILAEKIEVGDYIFNVKENQWVQVTEIQNYEDFGVYAPFVQSGNLVVDDFLT